MTNHHEPNVLMRLGATLYTWNERRRQRSELARLSDRDLHDVGLSWSDVAYEIDKPFWRA